MKKVTTVATAGRRHAHQDRTPVLVGLRCLEVAEKDGDQEHRLESLTEDDQERLAEHDSRRAEALVGELSLRIVDQSAKLDDVRADLVDGRIVGDQPADLGELGLRVGREAGVHDAQRHLDELEVTEVAVLRFGERLLRLTLLDELESAIDRLAHHIELADRLGTRDVGRWTARRPVGRGAGGRRARRRRTPRRLDDPSCFVSPDTWPGTWRRSRPPQSRPAAPWRCRRSRRPCPAWRSCPRR